VSSGRVYGETDHAAFALASENGRELWQRHLASAREPFVDAAPIVWDELVFTSTLRRSYALDESTGTIRWRFNVGGIYAGSIDAGGRLYAGTANPTRSGGTLPVLDAKTGKVLGTDRGTASTLAMLGHTEVVFGAGQAGRVVAWDGATNKRRWTRSMGTHCVIVGLAYAHRRLFVPLVDRCGSGSATSRFVALDAKTGTTLWERRLPAPALGCATVANDVVFTATLAGVVYAFSTKDGKLLWNATLSAGVDACPALVGGLLVVGAGVRQPSTGSPEIVAFGLPGVR
jgi:outer membrane protein assembly factor BamB